jgi:uncharacterized spore protein YtfJ
MFGRKKRRAESSTEVVTPDGLEVIDMNGVQSETAALATIGKLFDVYQPGVVFGEPSTVGDNTVITAAEVSVGMGLGFGRGSGGAADSNGEGGGGGGGGGSMGRPVAAIIITPRGVHVEPIVDVTKIAIAFFTTIGAIYMAWRSMRRQSK